MNERKADKLSKQMAKKKARKVYREEKATETVKIAKVKAKSDAKKGGILKRISTSIAKNKKSTKKKKQLFLEVHLLESVAIQEKRKKKQHFSKGHLLQSATIQEKRKKKKQETCLNYENVK